MHLNSAKQPLQRLALQGLSAVLVAAASPGLGNSYWLAGIALVPFVLSLRGLKPIAAVAWGLLGGMVYTALGKWGSFSSALSAIGYDGLGLHGAVLLFFLIQALPAALFALFWQWLKPWQDRLLAPWLGGYCFAACYLITPNIFAFTPAVMISNAPLLIQLADIAGEPLVLALLMTVNLGFARMIGLRRVDAAAVLAVTLPLLSSTLYGYFALDKWSVQSGPTVSVLSLRSDWPRNSSERLLLRDTRSGKRRSAIELTRAGIAANPDCEMIVWPESALKPTIPDRQCLRAQALAEELGRPLLASCHDGSAEASQLTARLYRPDGSSQQHDKARLVPGYERPLFSPADWFSDVPAAERTLLGAAGIAPFSTKVCYELHHSADLRSDVLQGAQFIVHSANLATFGGPRLGAWDLAMGRFRAVENRRSIVRSVNRGAAGMITASGQWRGDRGRGGNPAVCHHAQLHQSLTLYTRWGHSLFWAALAAFALACWYAPYFNQRRQQRDD